MKKRMIITVLFFTLLVIGLGSCASNKNVSEKKNQTNVKKEFAPPVWCGDPCPKCSRVCNKRNEHGGNHRDSELHTW